MKHSLSLVVLATALALGVAPASAAPTYRIKELGPGPHGWASQALAINDGTSWSAGYSRNATGRRSPPCGNRALASA